MEELFVNMGQINSLKVGGILTTVGLGSCIGITLYDNSVKVGVMGHIFLPKSRASDKNALPGKYADTGIIAMIKEAENLGALKSRLEAKLAGGANLFSNLSLNGTSIGEQNAHAVIAELEHFGIPIIGKDVGGSYGRKMRFYIESGIVAVTAVGKEAIEI
ncbi:MAG: chemotaxis protein CheD [Bacillota bacterium]|nr:chemotaxis protein CheD [Bacillota bacterium]